MYTRTLIGRLSEWQKRVMDDYSSGCIIRLGEERDSTGTNRYCMHSHYPSPAGGLELSPNTRKRGLGQMPRVRAIVVGIDVRGYSNRADEEQVFLTLALHAAATRALELLRGVGIVPQDEPRIVLERGDGAFLVFSFLDVMDPEDLFAVPADRPQGQQGEDNAREKKARQRLSSYLPVVASHAFSFVFALNALVEQANRRRGFRSGEDSPTAPHAPDAHPRALPIEVRYAVSYDDILLLKDVNNCLNGAGRGLVTCARILSSDHGGHLLVQESLLDALMLWGGLDGLCDGAWDHSLHRAQLPQTKVKSNAISYSDVFGFHYDRPLLAALGRQDLAPTRYHVGSHDVGVLDR